MLSNVLYSVYKLLYNCLMNLTGKVCPYITSTDHHQQIGEIIKVINTQQDLQKMTNSNLHEVIALCI